ncbi:MAG: GTPase RsgA, partial [Myxococcota bacterium]
MSHLGVAVEVEFEEPRATQLVRVQRRSGHVVGDRVIVAEDRLVRLPRSRELRRRSPGGGVHVVAAHLDLVVVVVALEPPPRIGLIDRAAVAARSAGLEVALCVNKIDLEGGLELVELLQDTVGAAMPVIGVSAVTSDG